MVTIADLIKEVIEYASRLKFWEVVDEWELGVRKRLGRTTAHLSPGLCWKWPMIDEIFTSTSTWRVSATPPLTIILLNGEPRTFSFGVRWRVINAKTMWEQIHEPESTLLDEVRSAAGALALGESSEEVGEGFGALVLSEVADTADAWGLEVDKVRCIDNAPASVLRLLQGEAFGSHDFAEE